MTSSKTVANNIDLLTEILVRLPAKPLIKFKCVSKQWLSLIYDPTFCLSHTRHHLTHAPTSLLLMEYCSFTPKFEMVPLKQEDIIPKVPPFDYLNAPPDFDFYIIQSCNGLLLCSSRSVKSARVEYIYYICNPTTKHFKRLSFPSSKFKETLVSICMAFDALKSNHYKLICFHIVKNKGRGQIAMYSSETDSWRPLEITFTLPDRLYFVTQVFCNGSVHWYSREETSLYFDVDTECFNTMPMPKDGTSHKVLYFGESQGHLHLIVTKWPSPLQFDVLEMAADYSGWFVRYHVNIDALRIAFPELIWDREGWYRFSVMHVIRAQKEEESIVVVSVDKKAISYNVHDGTSQKHCDLEYADYSWRTFPYFESLASV